MNLLRSWKIYQFLWLTRLLSSTHDVIIFINPLVYGHWTWLCLQGTIVDRIDFNIQNVAASVEEGFKQLQKVTLPFSYSRLPFQKTFWKFSCIFGIRSSFCHMLFAVGDSGFSWFLSMLQFFIAIFPQFLMLWLQMMISSGNLDLINLVFAKSKKFKFGFESMN